MNEEQTWHVGTLVQLRASAASILNFAGGEKIFLITGEMGAGKTTLIKCLCETLGTKDHLSSPTYSIVNEYSYPDGKIYHFDLYRVKDSSELLDLGAEEYLDSGDYCFIEWPEMILPFIESSYLQIEIKVDGEDRSIHAMHKIT